MSYTTTFDEKKYAPIREAIEQLPGLEPGGEVIISGLSDYELNRARWLLYDYLFHTGAKSGFRVKQDAEKNEIIVRRIGIKSQPIVTVSRGGVPASLDSLLAELVALDDLKQAEDRLGEWVQEGRITAVQLGQLLVELRRAMS